MDIDGKFFEKIILYKCLTDGVYIASIIDFIDQKYFEDKDISKIITIIKSFYEKYQTIPSNTEIRLHLTTEELKNSFKIAISGFNDIDKHINSANLYEKTETFLKERAVYYVMKDTISEFSEGVIDPGKLLKKVEDACGISVVSNNGYELISQVEEVAIELGTEHPVIPTKWKWLNDKIGGGFLKKGRALYIFAGQTNVGKSIVLGNIASDLVMKGMDVLLISLEMSEVMYAQRLYSDITKIPVNEIKTAIPTLLSQMSDIKITSNCGSLTVKEFPPSTMTPSQINAFIKKYKQKNKKLDIILIDYLNLIKAPYGDNSYERIKVVCEQTRATSYEFECPIVSLTQLNRTGYNESEPDLETIGEGYSMGATADAIFSLYREDGDEEYGIIRMGTMKNRFGPAFGANAFKIDIQTLSIYEDSSISSQNPDNPDDISAMFDLNSRKR